MRIQSSMPAFSSIGRSEPALKPGFSNNASHISSPLFARSSDKQASSKRLPSFIQTSAGWLTRVTGIGSLTKTDKLMIERRKLFEKFLNEGGAIEVRREDKKFPDGGQGTLFSFMNKEPNTYHLLTRMIKGDGHKIYQLSRVNFDNPASAGDLDLEIPTKGSPTARIMVIEADSENKLKNAEYFSKHPKVVKAFKDFLEKLASEFDKTVPPSQQA